MLGKSIFVILVFVFFQIPTQHMCPNAQKVTYKYVIKKH